jgi:hypothetical protein
MSTGISGIEHGLQRRHEVVLELVVLGRGAAAGSAEA